MIEHFAGGGPQMKDINFCSRNSSSGFTIFFLPHRHHHATTGTSSCFLNNPYLFADNRHVFLDQEICFTSVCRDKKIVGVLTTISRANSIIGLSEPEKKADFLDLF